MVPHLRIEEAVNAVLGDSCPVASTIGKGSASWCLTPAPKCLLTTYGPVWLPPTSPASGLAPLPRLPDPP